MLSESGKAAYLKFLEGGAPVRSALHLKKAIHRLAASLLALGCLFCALAGCGSLEKLGGVSELDPETPMMSAEKSGVWAAYFGRGTTGQDDLTARNYVISAAAQLKKSGRLERYMLFSCDGNVSTQIAQMKRAAEDGYDAFLIDPCDIEALEYAKQLAEEGKIAFAAEFSEEYSLDGVLGIECSTFRSDLAAANYICSAADPDKRACAVIITAQNAFGAAKRDAFVQTLAEYPDITVAADLSYRAGEAPAGTFDRALEEVLLLEPELSGGGCELIVLCDRIDGALLEHILASSPVTPLLAVSDRIDFLEGISAAAQNGVYPKFAIVNSPADLPAIALNILVRAASGESFRPSAVADGRIVIDINFSMTDEFFRSGQAMLGIADDQYIATGIMQDVVSGIFE